jgi:Family of unknown function (DUF5677)
MGRSAAQPPFDLEVLGRAIETFRIYCGVVALSLAESPGRPRQTIARNFVARGMVCTQSIFALWKTGSETDAWILHRSLVERLLLLHHLGERDEFSAFEEHSFLSMYEARNQLLSDADMKCKVPPSLRELQGASEARYQDILARRPRWRRPKAKDMAKAMDLGFLYRFGYDYASTHVHPMAGDGEADFAALASARDAPSLPHPTVVWNSVLVQTMLVQEALNVGGMRWLAIVYDFLDHMREFLRSGDLRFHATLYKIACNWPGVQLCEPTAAKHTP